MQKAKIKNRMWICPKCRQRFVNKNQSHSCGNYSVARFLAGKGVKGADLFKHFVSEYRKIGAFDLHPVKTRVTLVAQMRFCSVNKVGEDFINIHFVLTKAYHDPRFHRIENLGDRFFVHHLRISKRSDVSSRVRKYMRLAYDVGERKHIHPRTGI